MKPTAFLHVDVDGLWAIRRCYSLPEEETFEHDPVWEQGVPELARWFQELGLPASFFIVGRDLLIASKRKELRRLHEQGVEIANHTYTHKLGITRLSNAALVEEIQRTHELICLCGIPEPTGFRAPGYDVDERVLATLRKLGYQYDASLLPTFLSPALRVADAIMARRINLQKRQFGQLRFAVSPKEPYFPKPESILRQGQDGLIEFPVGVITRFRFPLTASAIFALGPERVCAELEKRASQNQTTLLLLHGIDAVDCSKPFVLAGRTTKAGGFNLSRKQKKQMILPVLETLASCFTLRLTHDFVAKSLSSSTR